MKTTKITYWISTGLVALMMGYSVYAYLTQPEVAQGFQHLGYPSYFRVELAIAKLIGVIILVAPVPVRLKEWAYAGFAITFISAFLAHTVAGDPVFNRAMPIVLLAVLFVSYFTLQKLQGHEARQDRPQFS